MKVLPTWLVKFLVHPFSEELLHPMSWMLHIPAREISQWFRQVSIRVLVEYDATSLLSSSKIGIWVNCFSFKLDLCSNSITFFVQANFYFLPCGMKNFLTSKLISLLMRERSHPPSLKSALILRCKHWFSTQIFGWPDLEVRDESWYNSNTWHSGKLIAGSSSEKFKCLTWQVLIFNFWTSSKLDFCKIEKTRCY